MSSSLPPPRDRVEFVPARRPDAPTSAESLAVRVLNPPADGDAAAGGADGAGGGSASAAARGAARGAAARALFPEAEVRRAMRWRGAARVGAGLANLGCTRYMNAVLQCLAYVPPLANLCASRAHSRRCAAAGACTYCALEALVRSVHARAADRVIAPTAIAARLRAVCRTLRAGRPEDAHEFLLHLLGSMQARIEQIMMSVHTYRWSPSTEDMTSSSRCRRRRSRHTAAPKR